MLLQSLFLNVYRGCFNRIFIFSPSVNLDHTWRPVLEYIERDLDVDPDKEQFAFDHQDDAALLSIIKTQEGIAKACKARGKHVYQIAIAVDDFADSPAFSRNSAVLHGLYTRGRHSYCSTFTATQKLAALSPIVRVNATVNYVFRLRNTQDLDLWLTETSALIGKDALLALYRAATAPAHGFRTVVLTAHAVGDMFFFKTEKKLRVEEGD